MNNERVTLAQDLHDGIAQELVALGFSVDQVIAECMDTDLKSSLRKIRFSITEQIERVRTQMHNLRADDPLMIDDSHPSQYREVMRILNEIVRNVEKHAEARNLLITISDDGKGGLYDKPGSFGVAGIQEKVRKLNGGIEIESDGNGTRIVLHIPLDR